MFSMSENEKLVFELSDSNSYLEWHLEYLVSIEDVAILGVGGFRFKGWENSWSVNSTKSSIVCTSILSLVRVTLWLVLLLQGSNSATSKAPTYLAYAWLIHLKELTPSFDIAYVILVSKSRLYSIFFKSWKLYCGLLVDDPVLETK